MLKPLEAIWEANHKEFIDEYYPVGHPEREKIDKMTLSEKWDFMLTHHHYHAWKYDEETGTAWCPLFNPKPQKKKRGRPRKVVATV